MIGLQLNSLTLNTLVGKAATQLRDACQNVIELQNFVVAQGQAGLEAAPISLSSSDAEDIINTVNYLYNVAAAYFGDAAIATDFDFDTAVAQVYGGQ